MVSGAAVAQWRITDGQELIRRTEGLLLAGSIGLNTYPYIGHGDWFGVAVHGVAPVMMGVALVAHDAVSRRLGQAIAEAAEAVPTSDDIAEQLATLAHCAVPAPQTRTGPEPRAASVTDMVEFEREFEPPSRAGVVSLASESEEDSARKESLVESVAVGCVDAVGDRARSVIAHSPAELETDPTSRAALTADTTLADADEVAPETAPERDRRAVVSLVTARQATRGKRGSASRASYTGRSPVTCAGTVDGALARSTSRARTSGLFEREMSLAEATSLARAVLDRGKSKQPADLLAKVYLAHSQGEVPNAIAAAVGLPHSTVDRAVAAAVAVHASQPLPV
jgi:hypothetical protein